MVNENLQEKWLGTSESTKNIRNKDEENPLDINKNYSGQSLEFKRPWEHFEGKSHRYCLEHRNDIIYCGYDYRNKILKRSLSSVFFFEGKRSSILNEIEKVVTYMVEHIKDIKKTFNYVFDKDYRDFN